MTPYVIGYPSPIKNSEKPDIARIAESRAHLRAGVPPDRVYEGLQTTVNADPFITLPLEVQIAQDACGGNPGIPCCSAMCCCCCDWLKCCCC